MRPDPRYAAEASASGGVNRGIGLAVAVHPLGPFAKAAEPVASPTGVCKGCKCDDVVMQASQGRHRHY
jgi:hypothetical protein